MSFSIRYAEVSDSELILDFVKELAVFEGMEELVTATAADILDSLFGKKQAEAVLGEADSRPAAFALFYPVYSTFLGRANLFLEDLFVREEFRDRGFGREILAHVAKIAVERGAARLDWYVLDENENGAAFYRHTGAAPLTDRRTYRIEGENLLKLAGKHRHEIKTGRHVP
ncbi:MAG: GNAT family N-acetyltransferase [Synergistaceae bacterium]|nr:GNAT family N-acetyltransferase [Synergistaceae bacterium]